METTKINWEGNINIKLILFHHVTQMLCENESSLIIFCLCVYSQHSPGKSQLMNIKHVFAQFMHGHLFRTKSASSIFSRFSPIISFLCWRKVQQSIQFPSSSHQYRQLVIRSYPFEQRWGINTQSLKLKEAKWGNTVSYNCSLTDWAKRKQW